MRRSLVIGLAASVVAATLAVAAPAVAAPPTYQVSRQITLANSGNGVAVDSTRGLLYVASRNANAVWVYDEATLTRQTTIPVLNRPYGLAIGPTGFVYVSEWTGTNLAGSVATIDPTTRTIVNTRPAGNSPTGVPSRRTGRGCGWAPRPLPASVSPLS